MALSADWLLGTRKPNNPMSDNPISAQNPSQFSALRGRLTLARDSLDAVGQRLQAVARAYYVVYAVASGVYSDREAYRNINTLMQMRIEADYGPSIVHEPYDAAQTGAWLEMSKNLVGDLEKLK